MTTLAYSSQGIEVLTGLDSVVDRVNRRLKFFKGEWLLNPSLGVDYDKILGAKSSSSVLVDDIKTRVLEVQGVRSADILDVEVQPGSNLLSIELLLTTEFGTITFTVVV